MQLEIAKLISACAAQVVRSGTDSVVSAVSTDSRLFAAGQWFVAIPGPHFDGHDYIAAVAKTGAAGVVVERADVVPADFSGWVLLVADAVLALGNIARAWREQCTATRYVGITGSNGKSTTKEMIAAVAGARGDVLKTEGNFNNLIGQPLTLLRLAASDATAVVEMGMNAAGEIAQMTKYLQPDIGLITNVTAAHLEELHTIENVASAKAELFANMSDQSTIIVNAEDPHVCEHAQRFKGSKIYFGMGNACDVQFGNMRADGVTGMQLSIRIAGKSYETTLPAPGMHNAMNALAATAAGVALDITPEDTMERLPQFTPMRMRMERVQLANGVQIVNDSYNANSASMHAALRTIGAAKKSGRFIAVLGDMFELGDQTEMQHREVGAAAAEHGVDVLYAVGAHAEAVRAGAESSISAPTHIVTSHDIDTVQTELGACVHAGDVVLVKGSRGMRMERVVEYLKETIGVD